MSSPRVVIIGGGLAGSAAGIHLARAGVAVTLLERDAAPVHKVCGEFLSEEALELLSGLGVSVDDTGAERITTLRVSKRSTSLQTSLPFRGASLSRRCLDELLLQHFASLGGHLLRDAYVTSITPEAGEWSVQLRSGESMRAANIMVATGKHDLPGMPRPRGVQNDLVGFKQYLSLAPEQTRKLTGAIELHLFPGGYAGLQLVEDHTANLCCVVRARHLGGGLQRAELLLERMRQGSALLRERLQGSTMVEPRPFTVAQIPYGLVQSETQEGLWRLGDQAAVIPSFTGDGMSMALLSGIFAAASFLEGRRSTEFQSEYAAAVRRQVAIATWISRQMVHSLPQTLAATLLRLRPQLVGSIALQTRLSKPILRRTLQALAERPTLTSGPAIARRA
ncbi:MAG: FAD-dependent oxidoreductase [Bryocella sp.]